MENRIYDVAAVSCNSYDKDEVRSSLIKAIDAVGGFNFIKPGMTVVIKANLVTFMKPEKAATTHPAMIGELAALLSERGAKVVIGDSPGGLYTKQYLSRVYSATGLQSLENENVQLNHDFGVEHAEYNDAAVLKSFDYTSYLKKCDAIINFCKLKSHGMIGMSAAVKNMFGAIPGTTKPEYHFRFPNPADFSDMIIDINKYFKPQLCIVDAVIGMEGNGPTQGTPRKIGALLCSKRPYNLDLVCAKIIGLGIDDVPTLMASSRRGFIEASAEKVDVFGNIDSLCIDDFKNIAVKSSLQFSSGGIFGRAFGKIASACLKSRPQVTKNSCIGCGECSRICPAKAITMNEKLPAIDRQKCIKCFCCQEFCPVGAMKVHRSLPAKILSHNK